MNCNKHRTLVSVTYSLLLVTNKRHGKKFTRNLCVTDLRTCHMSETYRPTKCQPNHRPLSTTNQTMTYVEVRTST